LGSAAGLRARNESGGRTRSYGVGLFLLAGREEFRLAFSAGKEARTPDVARRGKEFPFPASSRGKLRTP
jgi:hypothetical protein